MIKKCQSASWRTNVKCQKYNWGFTLIEILVAATIIGLLSAIAMTSYTVVNKSSRDAKRKADLEQVRTALELYRSQNGYYLSTGSGSWTEISNLSALTPDYIAELPKDPLPTTHTNYRAYKYQATDAQSGNYYGYCIEANFEGTAPIPLPCSPESGYNYSVRHP